MSLRNIIQPLSLRLNFKTKLSSARLSFILLQSLDRSRDVVAIWVLFGHDGVPIWGENKKIILRSKYFFYFFYLLIADSNKFEKHNK